MTLEQINEIEDKQHRLELLHEYVRERIQKQKDVDELKMDEMVSPSRDESFGMMSKTGKPGS